MLLNEEQYDLLYWALWYLASECRRTIKHILTFLGPRFWSIDPKRQEIFSSSFVTFPENR